jgi:hypothetical protein
MSERCGTGRRERNGFNWRFTRDPAYMGSTTLRVQVRALYLNCHFRGSDPFGSGVPSHSSGTREDLLPL